MCTEQCDDDIESMHLPKGWSKTVRHAVLNVIGVVRVAMLAGREFLIQKGDVLEAHVHRLETEVALLREELRIIGLRMARIRPSAFFAWLACSATTSISRTWRFGRLCGGSFRRSKGALIARAASTSLVPWILALGYGHYLTSESDFSSRLCPSYLHDRELRTFQLVGFSARWTSAVSG